MKIITILTFTFLSSNVFCQKLDSLGLGDNKMLNRQEYTFLNDDFTDTEKNNFDFKGKRIAFLGGTRGNYIWTKKEYFEAFVRPRIGTKKKRNYSLTLLTPTEKDDSGGYDAFILTPVKVFTDRDKKRVLTELGKR